MSWFKSSKAGRHWPRFSQALMASESGLMLVKHSWHQALHLYWTPHQLLTKELKHLRCMANKGLLWHSSIGNCVCVLIPPGRPDQDLRDESTTSTLSLVRVISKIYQHDFYIVSPSFPYVQTSNDQKNRDFPTAINHRDTALYTMTSPRKFSLWSSSREPLWGWNCLEYTFKTTVVRRQQQYYSTSISELALYINHSWTTNRGLQIERAERLESRFHHILKYHLFWQIYLSPTLFCQLRNEGEKGIGLLHSHNVAQRQRDTTILRIKHWRILELYHALLEKSPWSDWLQEFLGILCTHFLQPKKKHPNCGVVFAKPFLHFNYEVL